MSMLVQNVLNPNKREKIKGIVFHLFYVDLNTSTLFDKDFSEPIIFGSKNVVMTNLKKIHVMMGVDITTKIIVYSYIQSTNGYRRIDTYNGSIEMLGKYIRHY